MPEANGMMQPDGLSGALGQRTYSRTDRRRYEYFNPMIAAQNSFYSYTRFGGFALLFVVCGVFGIFAQTTTTDRLPETIGRSVEGRRITVERIGSGPIDVIFVGGIHGGYEANSILLARRFVEHFRANPNELAPHFTLHVIENMNPDGLYRITAGVDPAEFDFRSADTVPGRFNARGVDLNRNWDGQWQPVSYWGQREVNTGSGPFSEPETRSVRDYFLRVDPVASVFFQSAGAFLWYSGAEEGWEESLQLAQAYSAGSGYRVMQPRGGQNDFDITGSADDYFYTIGHRNVTVELTTHYEIDWERNLAGVRSLLAALTED